nr:MAG TPA: hypothetical protein [Caudoviricetes sp.]
MILSTLYPPPLSNYLTINVLPHPSFICTREGNF